MLIKAAQLLLSLSILVIIHELGHFLAARMFKTRVEKFYLFFDFLFPIPTVLNFALFKKKIGDTEYGIGWFPLGGYVKIAGMADESMDESYLNSPPQPDEYRSKKNWQKLIIMLGGIIMNVLLGWFIYSMLAFSEGEARLPAENAIYGINCDTLALKVGFRDGDVIQSHDGGKKFESFNSVVLEILLDDIKTVEVLRDGQPTTVHIPSNFAKQMVASRAKKSFIDFRIPCMVGELTQGTVIKGKLKKGDVIIGINDSTVHYFLEAKSILSHIKGQNATIKFTRGNDTLTTAVVVPETGLLGFTAPSDMHALKGYLDIVETQYGFFESFGQGAKTAYNTLVNYLKQFKLIFNREVQGYKQIGGLGTMGSIFPAEWDWIRFWHLTAFISLMLAVMNLLPIPMLDGGYVILLLFEMVSGKQLNDRVVESINRVGFIIVIFLMLYANGMDIFRAFFEK